MSGYPGFGVLLARLSDHHRMDIGSVSRAAGIGEAELHAVLDGAVPSPSLLRRLAPVLGLHTADLFVIADVAVPDELAPLDTKVRPEIPAVVELCMRLSREDRWRLRQFARALPQQPRTQPVPPVPRYLQYQPSFGAVLVRMLANRNLDWHDAVHTLFRITGGRMYLSAATIGAVGHGRKELSPELLTDLATVLGIPPRDLAALTGIDLPGDTTQDPAAADAGRLIWDLRRLTADQAQQVRAKAGSMPDE